MTLLNTTRALKLLFQLVHLCGQQKNILGGKIPNLCLKKPLRFFPMIIEEGLPHPLLKRIEACS